jgi:hypothetical protein
MTRARVVNFIALRAKAHCHLVVVQPRTEGIRS